MLGAKLTVIEEMIYGDAVRTMAEHSIPPTTARLVMEGVYSKFQAAALIDLSVKLSVEEKAEEKHEGTAEELKEYCKQTGVNVNEKVPCENGGQRDISDTDGAD